MPGGIDEIKAIHQNMTHQNYRNLKTGKLYYVLAVAYDATNARDGLAVVVYREAGPAYRQPTIFCRDLYEFMEKFGSPEKTEGQKLVEFCDRMMAGEPTPPEFSKTIDKHFWELG